MLLPPPVHQGSGGWDQASVGEEPSPGGGGGASAGRLQGAGGEEPEPHVRRHEAADGQGKESLING